MQALLTALWQKRAPAPIGSLKPGMPMLAARSNRRIGHVFRLALVAHCGSDGGNSDLAVAAIEALHLGLDLRWSFSVCWHLGPLVERKSVVMAKGPAHPQDRHEKSWEVMSCGDIAGPAREYIGLLIVKGALNPPGLFCPKYIPPPLALTCKLAVLFTGLRVMKLRYSCHTFQRLFG